jgi:3alpha(or 20beta)-hydroxysteroid dehydrogenase
MVALSQPPTNTIPMGRVADLREIASLILFLASDESSFSTGAEFVADGGESAAFFESSAAAPAAARQPGARDSS